LFASVSRRLLFKMVMCSSFASSDDCLRDDAVMDSCSRTVFTSRAYGGKSQADNRPRLAIVCGPDHPAARCYSVAVPGSFGRSVILRGTNHRSVVGSCGACRQLLRVFTTTNVRRSCSTVHLTAAFVHLLQCLTVSWK